MASSIGENLYFIRNERKETQEQVAESVGISYVSLSRYETGQRMPKMDILAKLAKHYGVTVDYLMGTETDQESEEDEADRIRERLRRDPSFRILFSAAENVKPEHLEAAARMLQALGKNDD